jgi:hypothetical protein
VSIFNQVVVFTDTIDNKNYIDIFSNVEANNALFIKRNLSNVTSLFIETKEQIEEDDVLNEDEIDNLLDNYKDKNDTTITPDYKIEVSKSSNHALTLERCISLFKTNLEEHYLSIINKSIENIPPNSVLKFIEFYKNKIKEIEEKYLLRKDYSLTEIQTYNNFCLKESNPITFKLQKKCLDAKISIENSKKVLTKNALKCWFKQCLDSKVKL